jgi:hypothetical protein
VTTLGDKNTDEDGFVLPSLFANYSEGSQISLRTTYKLKPVWSVGVEFNQLKFESWNYGEGEDLFNNSISTVTNLGISLKVHSKFKQKGAYNKLQLYAIISPCISNVKLVLQEPTFSIAPQDQMQDGLIERNSQSWGMNTSTGLIYSVTQKLSFFAEGGFLVTRVESQLHNDKFIKAIYLNVGLCFQIVKSKSFYL